MSFANKVYTVIKSIPSGEVMTYKEVAAFAGRPKAYRAVGNILHKNPDAQKIPCHRVVKSSLRLAEGYAFGGKAAQKKILTSEGIIFDKDRILKR